jgi:hypothetical protein
MSVDDKRIVVVGQVHQSGGAGDGLCRVPRGIEFLGNFGRAGNRVGCQQNRPGARQVDQKRDLTRSMSGCLIQVESGSDLRILCRRDIGPVRPVPRLPAGPVQRPGQGPFGRRNQHRRLRKIEQPAQMVDMGMGQDEQVDILWRDARAGQLGGGHIVGRDRQNLAKSAKRVVSGRLCGIFSVFGRKAAVDQDVFIRVSGQKEPANPDIARARMDPK